MISDFFWQNLNTFAGVGITVTIFRVPHSPSNLCNNSIIPAVGVSQKFPFLLFRPALLSFSTFGSCRGSEGDHGTSSGSPGLGTCRSDGRCCGVDGFLSGDGSP